MNKFHELSPKTRLLKILLILLQSPYGYTKKQLAIKYNVHEDTIKNDIEEMRNAGFNITNDPQYRYGVENDKLFQYLQDHLFISTEDELIIKLALAGTKMPTTQSERLLKKLANLHDISILGNQVLNKALLTKVDLLEKAKKLKKIITLIDYRSTNSSNLTDRTVEAYHISQREDILQAFDLEKNQIRHFKISRVGRIEISKESWKHEKKHFVLATDPFGIADNNQIKVLVKLKVGGYNALMESFPLTNTYLYPSAEEIDVYYFEGMVNDRFLGLSNFLLGYFEHVLEIQPQKLADHLVNKIRKISF